MCLEQEVLGVLHLLRGMPQHTNPVYLVQGRGSENSDKKTCGSNCSFWLQPEEACWKGCAQYK